MAKTADYNLGEFTFPRGWFMVADSEELKDRPIPVRFFGRDLAIYRGESGRVVMLDAYCPHMGAHLAHNNTSYVVKDKAQIEGDSIRCPFHGWKYGPDGKCEEIPYFKGPIPRAACVQSWPVIERTGVIFVWHDPEGGEPDYKLPPIREWDDPAWVHWKIDQLGVLNCHSQELIDNMADIGHMGPVHGSVGCAYFENDFKGPVCIQRFGAGHRTLVSAKAELLELETWYTGPGVLSSRMHGDHPTVMMIAHTPIDDGITKVWHALLVKSPHEVATEEDVAMARAYQEASRSALAQDLDIWTYKRPCFNVLQVPTDGPYHKVRIWYKQFYNPRARSAEFQQKVDGLAPVKGAAAAPESMRKSQYLERV